MYNEEKNVENELYEDDRLVGLADDVAYGILCEGKGNRNFIFLLLLFLILLTFLVSFVCFSLADYFNYVDDNSIVTGSVVFSFDESGRYINMENVYPVSDEVGKKLNGNNEVYEFTVSQKYYDDDSKKNGAEYANYEVSLIPDVSNTIDVSDIKVYLLKNGEVVKINGKEVNKLSELSKSNVRENGYTLIRNEVSSDRYDEYTFKMWLSTDYKVDSVSRVFKCYIGINNY